MKHSLLLSTGVLLYALMVAGCSSSPDDAKHSGSEPGNDHGSSAVQEKHYEGAASVGDYATYTLSGNQLSYTIKGAHYGSQGGTLTLTNSFGNFWQSASPKTGVMITDNLAIAKIPNPGNVYAVGLRTEQAPSPSAIANKRYLYIEVNNDNSTDGWQVDINDTEGVKSFTAVNLSGATVTGCWKINGKHLVAKKDTSDCSSVNDTTADYRFVIKPGVSRNGIVVDNVNGTGFGIGLEQKALSSDELMGIYTSYYQMPTGDGFGKVSVKGNTFTWYDCPNGICKKTPEIKGTITINQLCNGIVHDGVACATDSNGDKYHLFIDPTDNYYFAVGYTRPYLEAGSK